MFGLKAAVAVLMIQVSASACLLSVASGSLRFGDVYDRYVRAEIPNESFLRSRTFRLVAVVNGSNGGVGVGDHHDPTGYEIDGRVPAFYIVTRQELALLVTGNASTVASFATQPHYVVLDNWGSQGAEIAPTALQDPSDWPNRNEVQRWSRTFRVPLFGRSAELFSQSGERSFAEAAQLYCRREDQSLLCMVEYFRRTTGEFRSDKIEAFLIFSPT